MSPVASKPKKALEVVVGLKTIGATAAEATIAAQSLHSAAADPDLQNNAVGSRCADLATELQRSNASEARRESLMRDAIGLAAKYI